MSIFTVIKYPISDSPTQEQLDSLPHDLFSKWFNHPCIDMTWASRLSLNPENVALLRKLIMEYDE